MNENKNYCVICKNNLNSDGIKCSENHFHCKECFKAFIQFNCNNIDSVDFSKRPNGDIYCTMKTEANGENCCKSCQFSPFQIAQCVDSDTFEKYLELKISISNNNLEKKLLSKHQKDISDLEKIVSSEEIEKKNRQILQQQLKKEFPSALQCRRCGFGPIDFHGCWDLRTHHNQTSGVGTTNNSCPRCGWFTREKNDLQEWNGILPDVNNIQINNNIRNDSRNHFNKNFMYYFVIFYFNFIIFKDSLLINNLPFLENNKLLLIVYFITSCYALEKYISSSISKLLERRDAYDHLFPLKVISIMDFLHKVHLFVSIYQYIYFYKDDYYTCQKYLYLISTCVKRNMIEQIYFNNEYNICLFICKEIAFSFIWF